MRALYRVLATEVKAEDLSARYTKAENLQRKLRPWLRNCEVNRLDGTLGCKYPASNAHKTLMHLGFKKEGEIYVDPDSGETLKVVEPKHAEDSSCVIVFV